jgi:hypothetical protein
MKLIAYSKSKAHGNSNAGGLIVLAVVVFFLLMAWVGSCNHQDDGKSPEQIQAEQMQYFDKHGLHHFGDGK